MASPGMQVLQLVNLQKLQIEGDISEYFIPFLNEGDLVDVTFPTYPDMVLEGIKIKRIGNVINQNNRTVKILLSIPNPGEKLKPNMLSKIQVKDFVNNEAMILPTITIKKDSEGANYVYVAKESKGKLISQKQTIVLGKSYGSKSEVVEGLTIGDRVIVEGYNLVKNGSVISLK